MQPLARKRRPISRPLRPEQPLRYERLSDAILVKRAKDGDSRALDELCTRHAPRVERLSRYMLGDGEDARDAAQESLAKLCVRLRQFQGESQFATWLHRLVVNTCLDAAERRAARRWEPLLEDEREARDGDPQRAVETSELRSALGAELAEIPSEQAAIVVMKDALGYSFEQISSVRGLPVGTAKCYAHRARKRLRARLEERAA
jgi:RNA polymerase sigma-70 factor (ECF subfamily)